MVPKVWADDHPTDIPTKVVTIIESVNLDGHTGFCMMVSHDNQPWNVAGLLHTATAYNDEELRHMYGEATEPPEGEE